MINGKTVDLIESSHNLVARGMIDGKDITDGSEATRLWNKYYKVASLSSVDSKQKERREKEAQSFDL
ncbi:hypothetical protein EPN83_03525 [Patescibacteria group bacterium]|nr:MAG: hypothetical protein EPN83_03525 [Patescibacteria group bacterium]